MNEQEQNNSSNEPYDFSKLALPRGRILEMVSIKAGTFNMGSPQDEAGHRQDECLHQVTLVHDFLLGKTPVTFEQYLSIMDFDLNKFRGYFRHYGAEYFKFAMSYVSYDDALAFCAKLNEMYKDELPCGYVFTLPTEAQWEYACRAGSTTAYNYGDTPNLDLSCIGAALEGKTYDSDEFVVTPGSDNCAVGKYPPNAWGLYDMHGLIYEWCRDRYEKEYASDPEFLTQNKGEYCVVRGGYSGTEAYCCRSAYRFMFAPYYGGNYAGFRLALAKTE